MCVPQKNTKEDNLRIEYNKYESLSKKTGKEIIMWVYILNFITFNVYTFRKDDKKKMNIRDNKESKNLKNGEEDETLESKNIITRQEDDNQMDIYELVKERILNTF